MVGMDVDMEEILGTENNVGVKRLLGQSLVYFYWCLGQEEGPEQQPMRDK